MTKTARSGGNSEKMLGIAQVIEQVADSDVTVLIRGDLAMRTVKLINAPQTEVRFA